LRRPVRRVAVEEFAMTLTVDRHDESDTVRLVLRGELDLATRPILIRALDAATTTPGVRECRVDLSRLTFLDCAGLSALLHGRARADAADLGYTVHDATGLARQVLETTGVMRHLSPDTHPA
jgi:anti-anti-sigma factor